MISHQNVKTTASYPAQQTGGPARLRPTNSIAGCENASRATIKYLKQPTSRNDNWYGHFQTIRQAGKHIADPVLTTNIRIRSRRTVLTNLSCLYQIVCVVRTEAKRANRKKHGAAGAELRAVGEEGWVAERVNLFNFYKY